MAAKKKRATTPVKSPPRDWGKLQVGVNATISGMLDVAFAGEPYARADVMAREMTSLRDLLPLGREACEAAEHLAHRELVDRMWEVFADYLGPMLWVQRVINSAASDATLPRDSFEAGPKGDVIHAQYVAASRAWRRKQTDDGRLRRGPVKGSGVGVWPSMVRLLRALGYPLPAEDRKAAEEVRALYEAAIGRRSRRA